MVFALLLVTRVEPPSEGDWRWSCVPLATCRACLVGRDFDSDTQSFFVLVKIPRNVFAGDCNISGWSLSNRIRKLLSGYSYWFCDAHLTWMSWKMLGMCASSQITPDSWVLQEKQEWEGLVLKIAPPSTSAPKKKRKKANLFSCIFARENNKANQPTKKKQPTDFFFFFFPLYKLLLKIIAEGF